MSTSRPLLFGRVTALATDHESLALGLSALDELCSNVDAGLEPQKPAVIEFLTAWQTELARHFEAEESDDYFGVIRTERRSLRVAIDSIEREHAQLLAMSERMVVLFDTARWSEFVRLTRQLTARLRAHERLESTLMRRFLTELDE